MARSGGARPVREPPLAGRRVLVVEDDYLIAEDLAEGLAEAGALVLGPAGSLAAGFALLSGGPHAPDTAVLDVNLGGEPVFPLADALLARGVRVVLVTGYDSWALPPPYAALPRCGKPLLIEELVEALRG